MTEPASPDAGAASVGPEPAEPVGRHRVAAPAALASGDPAAIKALYAELGDDLWRAHGRRPATAPVLSLPQTSPVVAGLLAGVTGLVLDAGCGPNPVLSCTLAADPRRTVVAADLGFGTVRLARGVIRDRGRCALAVVADVEALPFRHAAFAGVACDDTIEHVPDDHLAMSELGRVARPDATIVVATPNRRSLTILIEKARDLARGRRRPAASYFLSNSHLREYAWPQFERLARSGMIVERRAGVGWSGGRKAALASRLVRQAPLHRLGQMIVVSGRPR